MTNEAQALSFAEIEAHDQRPSGHGAERRFLCPLPACGDHQKAVHKNLAVNIETGLWACKRCGASGKLRERWERRERMSPRAIARRAFGLSHLADVNGVTDHGRAVITGRVPTWRRRWDQAVPVAGTPGADYLASRGIPEAIAAAAGVRYLERWDHWTKDDAGAWQLDGTSRRVVFPIVDQVGDLVGIQGRAVDQEHHAEKVLTNGAGGVFSTVGIGPIGRIERLAIAEAPIDALSLSVVGVPALATQGTSWPEWLPRALAFKSILLAHDADEAGDQAAARLEPELGMWGATCERWWPPVGKDWNQDLQDAGADALCEVVSGCLSAVHSVSVG